MNALIRTPLGSPSPRDLRQKRKYDFHCEACGDEWDAPGHMWWLCRMRCMCGEVVEAK